MRALGKFGHDHRRRLTELTEMQWGILGKNIHLIASACYPFSSVLKALAEPSSVLPAEGMPGARYLPGSEIMDMVETEGERLVLEMFGLPPGYRATLQPHSGTQANQIAYNSVLGSDDLVLCLRARDGGHISHTVLIGRRNRTINFGLTDDGLIDYENLRSLAVAARPKLIIVGGSALPREIDFQRCGDIARECGACLHADISHTATFIAAGLHPSVFPHCDFVTFNTVKNLRGPNGGVLIYRESYSREVHAAIFPTTQGGANENTMLAKFAAFLEWNERDLRQYAESIVSHSRVMASVFNNCGIRMSTGGTDCHILLLEFPDRTETGADIERRFQDLGVLLNRNLIPNDRRSPSVTSGIRIGTTNLAILNYTAEDTASLAAWIAAHIDGRSADNALIPALVQKYQSRRNDLFA